LSRFLDLEFVEICTRTLRAREIIAKSGADTEEYFQQGRSGKQGQYIQDTGCVLVWQVKTESGSL